MKTYYKVTMGLALLAIIGAGLWLYDRYQKTRTSVIEQEKAATAAWIQSKAAGLVKPEDFSDENESRRGEIFENFFYAIQSAELIRMKVWDRNSVIIWSNLTDLIGQKFPDNHEVQEALEGKVEFEIEKPKSEHFSERQYQELSETYVPIKSSEGTIVGVLEVYQSTLSLKERINSTFQKLAVPAVAIVLVGYSIAAAALRLFWIKPHRKTQI